MLLSSYYCLAEDLVYQDRPFGTVLGHQVSGRPYPRQAQNFKVIFGLEMHVACSGTRRPCIQVFS
jgi:hypothetical protein